MSGNHKDITANVCIKYRGANVWNKIHIYFFSFCSIEVFIPFNGKNIQIMYFNCALSYWKINICECFYLNKLLMHHGLVGVQLINSKSSKATPTKSQDCSDFIYIETVLFGKTQLLEYTLPQRITFLIVSLYIEYESLCWIPFPTH